MKERKWKEKRGEKTETLRVRTVFVGRGKVTSRNTYMWQPEVNLECHFPATVDLVFFRQALPLDWYLYIRPDGLASSPKESPVSDTRALGLRTRATCLNGPWGFAQQVIYLLNYPTSPSPTEQSLIKVSA